jgi:signal transduction histidine kinase
VRLRVKLQRIDATDQEEYLFEPHDCSFYVTRGRRWRRGERLVVDGRGRDMRSAIAVPADRLLQDVDAMLCLRVPVSDEWTCRVFIAEPKVRLEPQRLLEFAHRAAAEVAPATYNNYLLLQMRARAEAEERARLARDLHDGLTQSLIGAEIQLNVLHQRADHAAPALASGVLRVRDILHAEVLNLRDLVHQTHAGSIDAADLPDYLAAMIDAFERDTGIATRFLCDLKPGELRVSARTSRELAQIVREALSNIRKHSGARQALIRLFATGGRVTLIIDDNGRGFAFAGRYDQAALDRSRKGPLVIKERVRSIGGELTVDSTPDFGSRLEITLQA